MEAYKAEIDIRTGTLTLIHKDTGPVSQIRTKWTYKAAEAAKDLVKREILRHNFNDFPDYDKSG